jgi:hypothetical protein
VGSRTVDLPNLLCILSGADERQRSGDDLLAIGGGQFQRVEGERALVRSLHGRVDAAFRNAAWQIALEANVVARKEHQGVRRSAYGFGLTENAIAIHLGCQQGGKPFRSSRRRILLFWRRPCKRFPRNKKATLRWLFAF